MGAVHFSIDSELVAFLATKLPLEVFIETGTYYGDSIEMVRPYFTKLVSIELSDEYFDGAREKFRDDSAITIIKGDSGELLGDILKPLRDKSILFWLDAHWCDWDNAQNERSPCPLLDELRSIGQLNQRSVILIDDARLFLCVPGSPHVYSEWPDLEAVLAALDGLSDRHELMVVNDIMVFCPLGVKNDLQRFAHDHNVDWLEVMAKSREHDRLHKEIQVKEKEIQSLARAVDDRLQVINLLEKSFAELAKGFDHERRSLQALLQDKEQSVQKVQHIADLRLEVIEQLEQRNKQLERWRLRERLKRFLRPQLGVLYHFAPRPIHIPARYWNKKKTKNLPTISIVTPSYNQAEFIERTVKSLLDQGYEKLEYMIQDGGSDDGTAEILEKYQNRLSHYASNEDRGQAHAIHLGFKHATGEIMAYLNSDDLSLTGALHYVARYFAKHPEVDVLYGHRILIDEYDREIGRWVLPPHCDRVLSWADYIPQESLFWRRRIWEKAGAYVDESFTFAMDWDLILRFRDAGAKFVRLPRFLGAFRVHPHQKTSEQLEELGQEEMQRLRERCHKRSVSDHEIQRNIGKYLMKHVLFNKLYRLRLLRY